MDWDGSMMIGGMVEGWDEMMDVRKVGSMNVKSYEDACQDCW